MKWFPKEVFRDYIQFAENLDVAYDCVVKLLEHAPSENLPSYFETEYYDKLKNRLGFAENGK